MKCADCGNTTHVNLYGTRPIPVCGPCIGENERKYIESLEKPGPVNSSDDGEGE